MKRKCICKNREAGRKPAAVCLSLILPQKLLPLKLSYLYKRLKIIREEPLPTKLQLTWRPHGTYDLGVHQADRGAVFEIIPVLAVQPLTQELHRGLSTVIPPGWHVDIIYKHHLSRIQHRRLNKEL